jgi:serine/threonine protein kinase
MKTYTVLPVQVVKLIVCQLIDVFGLLHGKGYVYRDLKASHVFLDKRLGVVVWRVYVLWYGWEMSIYLFDHMPPPPPPGVGEGDTKIFQKIFRIPSPGVGEGDMKNFQVKILPLLTEEGEIYKIFL